MNMTNVARALAAVSLIAVLGLASSAAAENGSAPDTVTGAGDLARCADAAKRQDADSVMKLCGAVIDSGKASGEDTAHAYADRGTAYMARQDFDHALDDLTHALMLKPDVPALYNLRSQVYVAQGDFGHAVGDLSEAIKRAPGQAVLYSVRGDAYEGLGDVVHAVADHVQAIRVAQCGSGSPLLQAVDAVCPQIHDGVAAYLAGDNAAAIAALDQAWQRDGKDLHLLLWLALARQRDRQDATTPLNAAIANLDLGPWPGPLIRYYLGRLPADQLQVFAQDPDPATAINQACDLDFYVASRALIDGRASAAAAGFGAAGEACPPNRVEFEASKIGRILASQPVSAQMAQDMSACAAVSDAGTDPASIVEFCDSALKNADLPDAWQFNALVMSAAASHRLGDDAKAAADLDSAIALRPGAPDAYRRRGIYRMAKGDTKGGLADFDQAIALNPELMEARMSRGWAMAEQADWPGATADFTDAINIDPYNPRLYVARGVVAFLSGDDAHAMENFGRAVDVAKQGAPYALLWMKLAIQRSHRDDGGRLVTGTAALDLTQWPGPILRYLDGDVSVADLTVAAGDAAMNPQQACEAAFYPGVADLIAGRHAEASTTLTQAKATCADASIESAAASILLRAK
jgi:lipoprotein NlpI